MASSDAGRGSHRPQNGPDGARSARDRDPPSPPPPSPPSSSEVRGPRRSDAGHREPTSVAARSGEGGPSLGQWSSPDREDASESESESESESDERSDAEESESPADDDSSESSETPEPSEPSEPFAKKSAASESSSAPRLARCARSFFDLPRSSTPAAASISSSSSSSSDPPGCASAPYASDASNASDRGVAPGVEGAVSSPPRRPSRSPLRRRPLLDDRFPPSSARRRRLANAAFFSLLRRFSLLDAIADASETRRDTAATFSASSAPPNPPWGAVMLTSSAWSRPPGVFGALGRALVPRRCLSALPKNASRTRTPSASSRLPSSRRSALRRAAPVLNALRMRIALP